MHTEIHITKKLHIGPLHLPAQINGIGLTGPFNDNTILVHEHSCEIDVLNEECQTLLQKVAVSSFQLFNNGSLFWQNCLRTSNRQLKYINNDLSKFKNEHQSYVFLFFFSVLAYTVYAVKNAICGSILLIPKFLPAVPVCVCVCVFPQVFQVGPVCIWEPKHNSFQV